MLTYAYLGVLALVLTIVSLKWYNLLLSFVACLSWLVLWAYNLDNPPTGIIQGSFMHSVLIYTFIILAILTLLLYFRNRAKTNTSNGIDTDKLETHEKNSRVGYNNRSLMDLSEDEYRNRMRIISKVRRK